MLFPVSSPNVFEGAGADVGQIESQFDFAGNGGHNALVVPGVGMPAVEQAAGRKGLPALGFHEGELRADIGTESVRYQRMNGGVDKPLLQLQHILHHVAKALRLFVAIHIVPAEAAQPGGEGQLHGAQGLPGEETGQNDNTIFFKLFGNIHGNQAFPAHSS